MIRSSSRVVLVCAVLVSFSTLGQRQFTNYYFENYSSVNGIRQDSSGFLWVSGHTVGRFDGHKLVKYYDSIGRSIRGQLYLDAGGCVWILERSGSINLIHGYSRKRDVFRTFRPETDGANLVSLGFEKDGKIWLGTNGKGIYLFDPRTGESDLFFNAQMDSLQGVDSNFILHVESLTDHLLLGTRFGLWRLDKNSKLFSRPSPAVLVSPFLSESFIRRIFREENHYWFYLPDRLVRTDLAFNILGQFEFPADLDIPNRASIELDRNGTFWIASFGQGLTSYTPKTGKVRRQVRTPGIPHSLPSDFLHCITLDRNQNMWIGSNDKGFIQLKKQSLVFHNLFLPDNAAAGMAHVLEAKKGQFLLHESKTRGIWISPLTADPDEIHFTPATSNLNLEAPYFHGSAVGKEYWWLGTTDNGVIGIPLNKATGLPGNGSLRVFRHARGNPNTIEPGVALPFLEDKRGTLWVFNQAINLSANYGTPGSLLRYEPPKGSFAGAVVESSDGALWILSDFHLQKLKDGVLQTIYEKPSQYARHRCVRVTKDGTIFIGSLDGLVMGTAENGKFNFKEVDAFRGRYVASIEEDKSGNLWLSGGNGIFRFNRTEGTSEQFSMHDGLSDNEFYDMHSTQTPDGRMLFTSAQSLVMFDPMSFKPSTASVQPIFTDLRVNNKPVRVSSNRQENSLSFEIPERIAELSELTLDYTHNIFTLEFSAMDLTSPQKNLYQYKLEGFDPDWIATDAEDRTATYTNLEAGSYTFKVRATNHDLLWSDKEARLRVNVLPPPWRTWWAYTGYSLLAAMLLVAARRSIVQRERLKASLSLEKVEREKEHFELEKAKEVDRVKTSFFTNISHEFRTPLTLIKGPVETLLSQFKDDPEVTRRLKLIGRNSDLLLRLINQLLDLAKLESGTLKVEKSDGEVYSFIKGAAGSFESLARQKGVGLKIDVPEGARPARFDKDKMETILINLINNAIKFTPQDGEVRVVAECWASPRPSPEEREKLTPPDSPLLRRGAGGEAATRQTLTLRISDTGIGIPPEHQSKIFERFHQVSEAHKEVGTGIGLALVKELITLMGGEISVESEPSAGTTFTVWLPLEESSGQIVQSGETQVPSSKLRATSNEPRVTSNEQRVTSDGSEDGFDSRPQVLVVEDNFDLRAFIIDSLGPEFHFHQAENGKQGLQLATEHIPDMIISDVMMPEMDGMEMTAKLKGDIKTSHIPLILLTAKSGEDSKLEGLSKGADDYLTKPFNKQELLLKVRNGTARMQKIREKMKTEVLSSQPAEKVLSQDEQFLNKVKETIIERMSDEQLSVESLADDIGMSRVQLYRKVSALTGMAVNELIRKLRLQRAAQLLNQNWGPVSQVAYEVGFSNLSYFSKVFREEFGVLPSEFSQH